MSGGWWLLFALGAGVAAGWAVCRWPAVDRLLEDPSPAELEDEARYARDRYVALDGFPQPDDPGPDVRYAAYPPGSLGAYPEVLPPDDGGFVTCEPWAVGAMHAEIADVLRDAAR